MDRLAALEQELRAEMASSLGRVAEKLEGFLVGWREAPGPDLCRGKCAERSSALPPGLARLRELAAGPATPEMVAEHAAARAQAELHLWYLVVQREAMGLRDHSYLYATYVIPKRIAAVAPPPAET